MRSTSVRIDEDTHRELKALAAQLGRSVGDTVSLAVRGLRQERMGRQMAEPISPDEQAWLDADLG